VHSDRRYSELLLKIHSRQKSLNRFGASAVQTAALVIDRWRTCALDDLVSEPRTPPIVIFLDAS
jgi:hypothetical protein